MNNPVNILIVVEGEKREKPFLQQLLKLHGINAELFVFHANIYHLYHAMEKIDFNGDLRDVLAALPCMKDQDLETLREARFAYTYLIFDCDAQHTINKEEGESSSIDEIIKQNLQRLKKMAAYFVDETDPSVGKLYVNYPMMESYRDCDNFFGENYRNARVCIDAIKCYKETTGQKKLANIRVDRFSKENFMDLLRMNICKLNTMLGSGWKLPSYSEYRAISEQKEITCYQKKTVDETRYMDVLNTTLFLLADYLGNMNGFYDNIVADAELGEQRGKHGQPLLT